MRIAIPVSHDRVATVFDFATRFRVIDISGNEMTGNVEMVVHEDFMPGRVTRLAESGVDLLICGAISMDAAAMISYSGIRIIPEVTGDIDEVFFAFIHGALRDAVFMMPGHGRAQGRGRGRRTGYGRKKR
ncbi:MAG: NifB/NifX family molybdenum-iron cluster-binding protein [Thermodesulfobacteriota bacterium]|nr:NifB/NifX family molybdenum-iron cluster-binding protein [Thermodesulfobacteriota bacterium]